jgi:hypothetical protein
MRRYKRSTIALIGCMAAVLFCLTLAEAKKPVKPPGGGGGGTAATPELVYIVNDAVITLASADGEVIDTLTGGSKGYRIRRLFPTWSPDGSQIAYIEQPDRDHRALANLYIMNSDGSSKTIIHQFNEGINTHYGMEWLAGGYISYTGRTGAEIINLLDGSIQTLDADDWIENASFGPGVDLSQPGSEGLVAFVAFNDVAPSLIESDIHLAHVTVGNDGSLQIDPATVQRLEIPDNQGFPVISPDGLQIAFYGNASLSGGHTLEVVDIDYDPEATFGTVQTLLIDGGTTEFRLRPTWSPDNQWIAFSWYPNLTPGSEAAEIAHIRWDGTDFTNVTNSGTHENYPNWTPVLPPQP